MCAITLAKSREKSPLAQVIRSIKTYLLPASQRHQPMVPVTHHFRVAEIGHIAHKDRIAGVLGKRRPTIGTVGDRLMLPADLRLGIDSNHSTFSKAGRVALIDDARAGENRAQTIGCKHYRMLLPMKQVRRRGVTPMHRTPRRSKGVVLIIQMPYTRIRIVEHTIRVVHPIG